MENATLTEPRQVLRSWRERLLGWPWRPWRREKTIQVPSNQIYKTTIPDFLGNAGREVLVCHPQMAARIREEISNDNTESGKGSFDKTTLCLFDEQH